MAAARIIGLVQSKGGSAKTTTALNLAAALVRLGHGVMLVDADPSGSATMVAEEGRVSFNVDPRLVETMDQVAAWASGIRNADADIVIIDAPGAMGAAFGATIAVSDLVLIPASPTVLDLRGAAETIGIIRRHRKAAKQSRPDIMIVPTRVDRRTTAGRDVVETLAALAEPVAPPITYRAIVADSLATGETVPADTPSAGEFDALAERVLIRLENVR